MSKGIFDPWRKVDPLRPTPGAAPTEGKKNLDDIDFDADLAIPGRYVIRVKGASISIESTRVATPKDALDVLVDCVVDLWQQEPVLRKALVSYGVGVRNARVMYNAPDESTPASKLESDHSAIWFASAPLDEGLADLASVLRTHTAGPIVKKHGITPMLTA